jgi:hypothetical protein
VGNQQNAIGVPIEPLQLPVTDCRACTFTVSNLPPDLTFDESAGLISGNIAFTAFTREDGGEPQYQVSMTARDATTGLASTRAFTWRITQGEVVSGDNEDGGGDGDGGGGDPGDGGAEGDAGDGGDASPLAGAHCTLYALDGRTTFKNSKGNPIEANTDANGHFVLPIPKDPAKPGFLKALEGFVVCNDLSHLIVSTYLNTKGLRSGAGLNNRPDGERLRGLKVNPATTVPRLILENLRTADGKSWSPGTDPVAINERFRQDTAELLTQSPKAQLKQEQEDDACKVDPEKPPEIQTVLNAINLPLLVPPTDNRTGMAAYVSSQLFLAGLKGGTVPLSGVNTTTLPRQTQGCTEGAAQVQTAQDFHIVLQGYLNTRTVTKDRLILLGLQRDDGIATSAATLGCG